MNSLADESLKVKLGIFATHAVQYHVPIWREISKNFSIRTKVFYFSNHGIHKSYDPGFGREFCWDTDLLEGYSSTFLCDLNLRDLPCARITNPSQLLDREKLNVLLIHGYTFPFARQLMTNKRRFGYRVILRGEFSDRFVRSGLKKLIRSFYLKLFYSAVDAFCYVGADSKNHLMGHGVRTSRMFFSPYSIDDLSFEKAYQDLDRNECRRALGIREDQIVILSSGKFIHRKQPLRVVEIFKNLRKDGNSRFVLIMLGDGPQLDTAKHALGPEIHAKQAFLPGFVNQSHLGSFFRASDVFVFPSLHDTWGLVVNEAMIFGLPCVVSNAVGCAEDLIVDNQTGYKVDVNAPIEEWSSRINQLVDSPSRLSLIRNECRRMSKKYSTKNAASGIIEAVHFLMPTVLPAE